MQDDTGRDQSLRLKRTLRLRGVVVFGLTYIAPLGIFAIYGVLDETSHGTPAGAYLLAFSAILFTAISYARMVALYPFAGSAYTYVRRAVSDHVGFLVGWAALLDYILLPMVAWVMASTFLAPTFPNVPTWVWIVALAGTTTIVNVLGLVLAKRINIALLAVQLVVLGAFVALALRHIWLGSGPGGLISVDPFFRYDVPFSATMAAAALAALSFLGFDAMTTLSEEAADPKRTMGRAVVIVAIVCGFLFTLTAYVIELAHPSLHFPHPAAAAESIARRIGGDMFMVVFLAGLVATQLAASISMQATVGRLLFAMGRDGVLPRPFAYLHPRLRTPVVNIVLTGLVGLAGLFLDLATAASFVNFGAFIAFTFVNVSVIAHALRAGISLKGWNAIPWLLLPALGAFTDVWLLANLSRDAHILGGAWFALGVIYLLFLTRGLQQPPPSVPSEGRAAVRQRDMAAAPD
jgi:putrescine importer